MVTESNDRGQVILIGAITLAFIILGIVIVFNGVLFTETISAGDTSQSAATADKVEQEVVNGVACSIVYDSDPDSFASSYQNSTAESNSAVVNVDVINSDESSANVTITYDSADLSYSQTRNITDTADQCPEES
ncbi:hypothetical protein [Natronorubrum daqingense]|uniref:Flagellin n=1 Tax=Natronorubrum daqingense TaxID=588898 RepID=A0A1N6Z629_9EURY|nr:hypothetical protein [Natronorubrum daqingense]APX95448.1 hypothetical protein BB347_01810 [Natronorubrum daqingense]SIR22264.1 hypothetical protein SAMN05421809_0692 [Natronorubrum daqingense]